MVTSLVAIATFMGPAWLVVRMSRDADCSFEHVEPGESFALEWGGQARRGNSSPGLSTGMGRTDPGAWRSGIYRVHCTVEGVEAPEAGFIIR